MVKADRDRRVGSIAVRVPFDRLDPVDGEADVIRSDPVEPAPGIVGEGKSGGANQAIGEASGPYDREEAAGQFQLLALVDGHAEIRGADPVESRPCLRGEGEGRGGHHSIRAANRGRESALAAAGS